MDVTKFHQHYKKRKWFLPLIICIIFSTLILIITTTVPTSSPTFYFYHYNSNSNKNKNHHRIQVIKPVPNFVESKLHVSPVSTDPVPRLAYLISGSVGDGESLKRTLKALYHPRNQYVLHLDLEAPPEERMELVKFVREEPLFAAVGNVKVIVKANLVTYRGPTMITNTLHAAAILLKECGEWDWFINLSASDYPLVTQDDMLHTLSEFPRHLNFIEHTSDLGWKRDYRAKPVIIDQGLYMRQKWDVLWLTEKKSLPTAYRLFQGSAWMMLSRPFVEYLIWGWDNLPRIVLMYYANFVSSPEGYFHTVICNANEFRNTTVNHDLHFISWDDPPKQHPHYIIPEEYEKMVKSNAPFARKFSRNSSSSILDKVDSELLGRNPDGFVPGGWLDTNGSSNAPVPHSSLRNTTNLKPSPGAKRLKSLITGLLSADKFNTTQCA